MSGRIRSIKPELLEDEPTAGLSDAAWRVHVSLWLVADDHGNVRLGEKYVAAQVWQDTARDAATPIRELIEKRFLVPYAKGEQRYARIRGWATHQRIDNAGKPRVPPPEADDGSLPTWFREFRSVFSASLREPPQSSAGAKGDPHELPLARRARAQSGGRINDTDHDPDLDQRSDPDRAPAREVGFDQEHHEEIVSEVRMQAAAPAKHGSAFFNDEQHWYVEGISASTGTPCPRPDSWDRQKLEDAIRSHFGKLKPQDAKRCVVDAAKAYADARKPGEKIYVKSFIAWIDSGNYRLPRPEIVKPRTPPPPEPPTLKGDDARAAANETLAALAALGSGLGAGIGTGGAR